MGLFEGESLPKSARQIHRAGVSEQDNNVMGGDIYRRNMQKHFCIKKQFRLVVEKNGGHIEHRLKQMNFTLMFHFLRRCFEVDNTHIICN